MKNILLVGLGGFLGAVSRYLLATSMQKIVGGTYPFGIWAVNLIGSLALGYIAGQAAAKGNVSETLVLLISIGFIGAFTTFSTVTVDTLHLLRSGHYALAALNSFGQLVLGIGAAGLGFYLGQR